MVNAILLIMIISGIVAFITFFMFIFEDTSFRVFFISFIICVVSCIFLIVGGIKCDKAEWTVSEEPYAVESIVALNDNNLTNGKIYLRRGYIEEDLYYQYIVQLNNGGFKANKVKSSNATLFYDSENYRIEWYTKTKKWLCFTQEANCCRIYIPEGSITADYSVDLS